VIPVRRDENRLPAPPLGGRRVRLQDQVRWRIS
jgi:hypothetical protein